MNLSLERVLRFVAVAEQLSFTRAAALLGIDQPWLSRQVMQLEEQLGFMLFDRGGSKIALTPEGLEFFRAAQQVAEAAQKVRQKAEEMSRRNQSAISIGVSYATFPLDGRGRLLSTYAAIRPNVSLQLSAHEWSDDVVRKVAAAEIDFGLVFGPVFDPELDVCVIADIELTLAVPEEDPLAGNSSIALAELAGRKVGVGMNDTQSPRYLNAYSWVEKVGAIPVHVLEGRRFLFDVAERDRLIYVCYTPADRVPAGFVRRPIKGEQPRVDLSLVRFKRTMSPAGERLWRLGQEMAAEGKIAD